MIMAMTPKFISAMMVATHGRYQQLAPSSPVAGVVLEYNVDGSVSS